MSAPVRRAVRDADPILAVIAILAVVALVVLASITGMLDPPEEKKEPSLYERILEEERIRERGLWK